MTPEEIALKARLLNESAAWEIALQLSLIERDLLKLIHIELFRSPGYEEFDADLPPDRVEVEEGRIKDRQRQTERPQPTPEANK